jgi:signal transduction histidine kinase
VVSGTVGEETAVKAMRAGAHDYLMKGSLIHLGPVVQREINDAAERRKQREIERELKEKNAQLLQSQKMEAIGSLAGGIAHDFNNMLGVILLLCDAAAEELDNLKATIYYFNQIGKAAEHAALLTRQLLTYSRKNAVDPVVLSLNDEMSGIEQMLHRTVGESIHFELDLHPEAGNILFDRSQASQLIMNLAVNARDAMPRGGHLVVSTRKISVSTPRVAHNGVMPEGNYVVLSVSDTGCGMSEETIDRIFEPFFTTKAIGKGTGLGLSTVYGIAKQNSSFITVKSKVGEGTSFEIFIPAIERPTETAVQNALPENLSGSETVLIVEDQGAFRLSMRSALEKSGYKVVEAEHGRQALSLLKENKGKIDLVITDVVMPEMNGADLEAAIRRHWPDTRVMYMSGYCDEEALDQTPEFKRSRHFLEKPFNSRKLLQQVRAVLNY